MSQHGYMRHTATPPLVLEIGQKLWQYCHFLPTGESILPVQPMIKPVTYGAAPLSSL